MKKRVKGLLALWMVLVMAVSLPATVFAATTSDVYFYTGTSELGNYFEFNSTESEQLKALEAFVVDASLYEQYSGEIPEGYELKGWRLWKYYSGNYVSSPIGRDITEKISQNEFDYYFSDEETKKVVMEPLLEKLTYWITHQPTNEEPYVSVNEESNVISYSWHRVQTEKYSVVEGTPGDNQINAEIDGNGSYDIITGMWIGSEQGNADTNTDVTTYLLNTYMELQEGDILQIIPEETYENEISPSDTEGMVLFSRNEDGSWLGKVLSEGNIGLKIMSAGSFSVQLQVTRDVIDETAVSGQETGTFSGANGNYACKVIFDDKIEVISDKFDYVRYDITCTSSENGSCEVQVDDETVEKAAAGNTVTITPIAAEGYEPDTVTVTKTDDSSTTVMVKDNSFTMPDYPVTIKVTFKKKTYAVALPKNTVGYKVESTQKSPVEYGDSYIFKVTLGEGYVAYTGFAVMANGIELTAKDISGNVYTYIIENVTKAQEIMVSGVKDGKAPTITITLDENTLWQSFLNNISFGLFFKEAKSLTINASDGESGIRSVEYYLTDTDLFPEDKIYTAKEIESAIPAWTTYTKNTGSISLTKNDTYVLYVKAKDQSGNVSYASTTGIVIDTAAPVISGIDNGGKYYGDISLTISDDYLETVTVDNGEPVAVDSSIYTYTITADNGTHTIRVTDKAGNEIFYQINVYEMSYGISSEGVYNLKQGIPYKLGSGKWKVLGDDTIYEGGNTFYVQESGTFEFQKQ